MNREALSVLNLPEDVIGRNATEVALSNDLLRRLLRELCDERKDAEKEPLKIYADNKGELFPDGQHTALHHARGWTRTAVRG